MRVRKDKNFISFFDEKTGHYLRTGILENGKDTGKDPFRASFPELLDVGIMGHCGHGKAGLCQKAGVECYQDGLHAHAPNMRVEDFADLAAECRGKTFQFALGGCGDPDQHESFGDILRICRENRIVPSFTTSGLGMTGELAKLCKAFCGAVTVSWHRHPHTLRAIRSLVSAGVKTNIHYVLTSESIAEATERIRNRSFPEGINAIVFLLHKPVGLGTRARIVRDTPEWRDFLACASGMETGYKIGFDSCTVPALLGQMGNIAPESLDTCEAARWSAYVTPDKKLLPCSFDNQGRRWAVDLNRYTLQEAWESEAFEDFRDRFRQACPHCALRNACLGGCPICPEIVLCGRE